MEKNCPPIHAEIAQALEPVFSASSKVLAALVFGSSARGENTGKSDIDIAVYVRDPERFTLRHRMALHGDCCRALNRNDVDLVVMNQLGNLILLEHIIRQGVVIYSMDHTELDFFMAKKLHQVIDFRYQREKAMSI